MAINLKSSSPLVSVANTIVPFRASTPKEIITAQNNIRQFIRFLDIQRVQLEKQKLPDERKIKRLANLDLSNSFGNIGSLLKNLASGALDIAGFVGNLFPIRGKSGRPGVSPTSGEVAKPKIKPTGGGLRLGGLRAVGVANALFAGLDFATGLAEGETVGKAAAGAGGSLAGSLLGGAIGQALIPIPGVGFVLGSMAGGFLGGYAGDRGYELATGGGGGLSQKLQERIKKQEESQKLSAMGAGGLMEPLNKFEEVVSRFENFANGIANAADLQKSQDLGDEQIMEYGEYPERDMGQFQTGTFAELEAEGGITPSSHMSSGYKSRSRPNHMGVDYAMPNGTPISVIQPGTVTRAGWFDGYGYGVQVNHPGGINSFYAHLGKINVSVGQQIDPGTVIGNVGSTGRSTGPHLHFEIDANGKSKVDPTSYADKIFRFGGNVKTRQREQSKLTSSPTNITKPQETKFEISKTSQVKPQQKSTVSSPPMIESKSQTQPKPQTAIIPMSMVEPAPIQQKIQPQQYQYYPSYSQNQALIIDRPMIVSTGNRGGQPVIIPGGGGGESVLLVSPPEGEVVNSLVKTILLTNLSSS